MRNPLKCLKYENKLPGLTGWLVSVIEIRFVSELNVVSFRASDFRLKHCPWSASQRSNITQYTSSVWMWILALYFQTAIIVETLKAFFLSSLLFLQSGPPSSFLNLSPSVPPPHWQQRFWRRFRSFTVFLHTHTHTPTHTRTCTEVNFMIDFFPH